MWLQDTGGGDTNIVNGVLKQGFDQSAASDFGSEVPSSFGTNVENKVV